MKFCKYVLVLIIIVAYSHSIQAQSVNLERPVNTGNSFHSYWNDFKYICTNTFSPATYKNWKLLTYTGLTTLFLLSSDMEFHEEYGLEKEYSPIGLPNRLGNIGLIYDKPGTLYFTLGLAGTLYGTGKILNDYKLQKTTGLMARSLIITGIVTTALKVIIGRARPYVENDPHQFKPFNFKFDSDYMSMPSGHTSSIFAMITVIAKQYDSWYIKIPAYTFAVSVAFHRMNSSKHWGSDLLIGGTLGYLIGSDVVNRHKLREDSLIVQPIINGQGVGLAIQF